MSASAAGSAGVDGASAGAGAAASLIFLCARARRRLAQLGSVVVYALRLACGAWPSLRVAQRSQRLRQMAELRSSEAQLAHKDKGAAAASGFADSSVLQDASF